MQISLPSSWGPVTLIAVLYFVAAALGGGIELYNNDLTYAEYVESLKWPAGLLGLTGLARGIAMGGPGTGFGTGEQKDADVRR